MMERIDGGVGREVPMYVPTTHVTSTLLTSLIHRGDTGTEIRIDAETVQQEDAMMIAIGAAREIGLEIDADQGNVTL